MAIIPTLGDVSNPRSHGYDGTIDTVLIRLGVTKETPIKDQTAEATPPKVDTSETAEDVRDEAGRRYSRSDLSGGAGLDFLHTANRSSDAALRFWDSKGVDVFGTDRGDIYDARLMRRMDPVAGVNGTAIVDVATVNGVVYVANGTGIYSHDGTTATLRVTLANITKMVGMGNSLYTLDTTNGIQRFDVLTSWTPTVVDATIYDDMWAVKSRILAVKSNVLYDVSATTPTILTLPPAETVNDVIDAGPAILAFSTTGTIHTLALDDSLILIPSGDIPFVDEVPTLAAPSFNTFGLATAEENAAGGTVMRFYVAQLSRSAPYTLTDVQLVFQIGDRDSTGNYTAQAMLGTRDSIYVAVPEEDSTTTTLWRYYTPTGGYARSYEIADDALSCVEIDDRMWVAATTDVYRETDLYITEGYVIGPLADFFTADEKQWVGGELSGVKLVSGTGLELYETTDPAVINDPNSTGWTLATKLRVGEEKRTATLFAGNESRYHAAKIVLRSDSTRIATPGFRSYSFRGLPNPDRDILIQIPINVSDQIDSPGKRSINVPGRGEAIEAVLREYEGKQVVVELYRPALLVRGLIEKFESVIETITTRGAVRRILYCLIRGTRITDDDSDYGTTTTGDDLGVMTLGLPTLGTREVGAS